jgi:hypothetical protein
MTQGVGQYRSISTAFRERAPYGYGFRVYGLGF